MKKIGFALFALFAGSGSVNAADWTTITYTENVRKPYYEGWGQCKGVACKEWYAGSTNYFHRDNCIKTENISLKEWFPKQKKPEVTVTKVNGSKPRTLMSSCKDRLEKSDETYTVKETRKKPNPDMYGWNVKAKANIKIVEGARKGRQYNVHVADFTGNGRNDMFAAKDGKWFLNYGITSKKWTHINNSNVNFKNLAFGDFNGDGKTDVFFADGSKWNVSYGGTKKWTKTASSSIKTDRLRFGDFNGDGKTDVFFADGKKWNISYGGNSSWKKTATSSITSDRLLFGDFNADGQTDVFFGDGKNWKISYSGNTPWTQLGISSTQAKDLMVGDFNGDRYADLLYANSSTWKIAYNGRGPWKEIKWNMNQRKKHLILGDYSNDRATDIMW